MAERADEQTAAAPQHASPLPRGELPWVLGLAGLAFALRVLHVLGSQASPFFDAPQMDALYHVQWAQAFAAGERFQEPPFFRAPLYPWALGLLFKLLGDGLLVPRLVQALFGAAATALVHLVGARAFDRRVGRVAALLWATSWVGIFFDGELLLEPLAIPLSLLGLYLMLGSDRAPRAGRLLAAGLAFGLSAITRLNVLLLMPLLAFWLLLRPGALDLRARLLPALWLTLGTLLPILPITAYNQIAGGDTVLVASQGGLNLWIGNNPVSDGTTAVVPGTREDWWGGHHDAIAQAELAEGRELRPSEVSQHFADRAFAFMRSQPGAWLALMGRKLRLFLWNAELGNNEVPRFLFERFSPLAPLTAIGFGVLLPLAALGLVLGARGGRARLPLWGYLLAYSASVVLFFVNARFRLPVLPVLAVYAAAGLVWLAGELRNGARGRALAALVAVLAGVLFCHTEPAFARDSRARESSNGWLMLGTAAYEARDLARAAEHLEQAVRLGPRNGVAWRGLGVVRRELGEGPAAEAALARALSIRPDDSDALDALAELLIGAGRLAEAQPHARGLVEAAPASARGPYALGRVHFGLGRADEARAAFELALEREPRHFGAAYSLGVLHQGAGRPSEAAEAFERALAGAAPDDPRFLVDAYARAVRLRAELGQGARADGLRSAALRRFGDTPELRELLRTP